MKRIDALEVESLKIIRSIPQISKHTIQLWSTGKDSTLSLHLVKKAFGYFPYRVIHIDTGRKHPKIYEFRDKLAQEWNIPLKVIKNDEALKMGISPKLVNKFTCCTMLKTDTLKNYILESRKGQQGQGIDSIIVSIRHDENYVRGVEDIVSKRSESGKWEYTKTFGGFGLTAPEQIGCQHIRIHPILAWREEDVWEYTLEHKLPVNPLYFSDGENRYRSLGCDGCTDTLKSKASTVQEILNEVYMTPGLERSGRSQDKEGVMLALRGLGYL